MVADVVAGESKTVTLAEPKMFSEAVFVYPPATKKLDMLVAPRNSLRFSALLALPAFLKHPF